MSYSVRCRNSRCRHRRVIAKHPDDYKIVKACPSCGQRAGWRPEGRQYNRRGLCHCDGPDAATGKHFPHRTTHPLCDSHPKSERNHAELRGWVDPDMPEGRKMNANDECPF